MSPDVTKFRKEVIVIQWNCPCFIFKYKRSMFKFSMSDLDLLHNHVV